MADKIRLLCIAGPTASGKSACALRCAEELGGEIISCDSMQLYRRMDIGTAKPTVEERKAVPHHMIDVRDVTEPYSLADYVSEASEVIYDVVRRGKLPIICGGTGLYMDTLLAGSALSEAGGDESIRRELSELYELQGAEALHRLLRNVDPESADAIHKNNVRRVIRAIEIYRATGIPKSEWDRRSVRESRFDALVCVLTYGERSVLYDRIDRRVELMMEQGLEAEARSLWDEGLLDPDTVAGQAIGYKEFIPFFKGEEELSSAVGSIKQATRRYAKRQETWFRRNHDAVRIDGADAERILSLWHGFAES